MLDLDINREIQLNIPSLENNKMFAKHEITVPTSKIPIFLTIFIFSVIVQNAI